MSNATMSAIPSSSQNITAEKLRKFLPKGSATQITDDILAIIHGMENTTGLPQNHLEEDLMSYMHLIGKVSGVGISDLINAVKYCNLKRNHSNREAWAIVFPDKFDLLTKENRQVDSHVSMYNSTRLVVAIDKEMIIPAHIMYSGYFHAAVKKQFDLMNGIAAGAVDDDGSKVSPMVQHLAAKELAILTKAPEDRSIELKIGQSDAVLAGQHEMNTHLAALVANQQKLFEAGHSASEIQKIHMPKITVVDAEIDDE